MALSSDIAPQGMSLAIRSLVGPNFDCTTSRLKGIQAQFLAFVYILKILAYGTANQSVLSSTRKDQSSES